MRRVVVFTSTRAEYGLLRPVMRILQTSAVVELRVLVSGTHLHAEYGRTVEGLHADGFTDCLEAGILAPVGKRNISTVMARGLVAYYRALDSLKPDLLLLLGDRYETFCAATAATILTVPIAHIHGGEVTSGAMDDAFRHAITKMSHLHFTTIELHRQRVIQMGESPERVWNVGSLGVENIRSLSLPCEAAIRKKLRIPAQPYILCTFHPVTLQPRTASAHLTVLLDSLETFSDYVAVFTAANADPEGDIINRLLDARARQHAPNFRYFPSLGVEGYLAAARDASCVMGNSSSGVIEIPSLGTPVIDIGERQKGRLRAASVLHCEPVPEEICNALSKALSPSWRAWCKNQTNPYDAPGTSAAIAERLCTFPLSGVLNKNFHDIPLEAEL